MAIRLQDKPNTDAPNGVYPFGNIRDNNGSGNGTPVNKLVYADLHQFFAKLLNTAGITPNGLPENQTNGWQYVQAITDLIANAAAVINANVAVINANTVAIINAKNPNGLITKVVNIGAWNMNVSFPSTLVAHGLSDIQKIRSISVIVVKDAPAINSYDFLNVWGVDLPSTSVNYSKRSGCIVDITSTNIELGVTDNASSGSVFKSASFDAISQNRGWITIIYAP